MIDGSDPEYLEYCPASKLRDMAKHGFMVEGRAMMPTVTNVNNVSMITASYSGIHGVTSNFWHNQESDQEGYMESAALAREEAAARFHLIFGRIGDIMVLGAADVFFGNPKVVGMPPGLRAHGSLHEDRAPIIGCGGSFHGFEFREYKDLGRYVFDGVLT